MGPVLQRGAPPGPLAQMSPAQLEARYHYTHGPPAGGLGVNDEDVVHCFAASRWSGVMNLSTVCRRSAL